MDLGLHRTMKCSGTPAPPQRQAKDRVRLAFAGSCSELAGSAVATTLEPAVQRGPVNGTSCVESGDKLGRVTGASATPPTLSATSKGPAAAVPSLRTTT